MIFTTYNFLINPAEGRATDDGTYEDDTIGYIVESDDSNQHD